MRLAPRSLTGQLALLVAAALFVAQAINFAMLLQDRRQARFEQATGPAITRILDAAERLGSAKPPTADRGRVRFLPADPIADSKTREAEVERRVRADLLAAGRPVGDIVTRIGPIDPTPPYFRRWSRFRTARMRRPGNEIVIAVEMPGRGWLVAHSPWLDDDAPLIWRLVGQTLIIYGLVLLPVLWAGRRIARPLKQLAEATQRFQPGREAPPLPERGPHDVRELIAAFNLLTLRVTAMIDEKDRMLGAIGHDLRTPLAALRVRIESVDDEADRARMAETIDEMNRTLDDILSLARLGRPSEPPTEVDLAALVDAVVEDFRDLGEDVTFAEADRLKLTLRPSLMRRAVRNLIENAVKYGKSATVRLAPSPRSVAIIVSDQGPGIPTDRLTQVFDPFTRLESSRNRDTGGIGLGLALAQAIVREAGGDIALANRAEGGLDATITLPR